MNSGENIYNAFDVIKKTYNNVNKLIEYCKTISETEGKYILKSPRFLRYKSDPDIDGWAVRSFILLFQSKEDEVIKANNWRDGPVYLLEINLFEPEAYDYPIVQIAKYEYEPGEIDKWQESCSPSEHWGFYEPMYSSELEYLENEGDEFYDARVTNTARRKWWGLRRIVGFAVPLTDITHENAEEIIFGKFDILRSM